MSIHARRRMKEPRFKPIEHDKRKPPKELPLDDLLLYASRALMRCSYAIDLLHGPNAPVRQLRRLSAELGNRGRDIKHPKKPKVRMDDDKRGITIPLNFLIHLAKSS